MLSIPYKESLLANIDPADLADLQAEAEANRAEARDALVTEDWNWRLPEQFQG